MALVIFLEVFAALLCFLLLYYSRNDDGPSPKSFPIVGMMPGLLLNVHRIHDWCTEVLDREKGTFVFEGPWFTKMTMLVTCDPANIHYILSSNFNNFPKGPEFKKIFDFLGDGIFNSDGDLWENQRTVVQGFIKHQLFHTHLLTTTRAKVENELVPVIQHAAEQGLVVNLEDIFQRFTLDSICILVTGYDPKCLSLESPKDLFSKAVEDAVQAIFYRHAWPASFIKLQKWLNIGQERKYKEAWAVLDDIIAKYICQKRKQVNELNHENGVDLLTSYITEENSSGLKCDDKFLRDTILNTMIAGRDTTSSALTWVIWLVSRHPIVENKIVQELESKLPSEETKRRRIFKVEEVKDLVYLHAALCEAVRLYPPIPFNHKEPLKADVLPSGHRVHPNTKVLFNLYSMGRMKWVWGEDCLEFKPERWINERGGIKHEPSYKFPCFGAGPRKCVGKEMSFVQMKAVVCAIVYNYRIQVLEETPIIPAISINFHPKNGLMANISTRWD
ncbi:hypothetical protein GQ457_02G010250 [Hibiscus cannabinus]